MRHRARRAAALTEDFKYTQAEPAESYDHAPTTDPIPVVEARDLAPADYGWPVEDVPVVESVEVPPAPVDVYDLVPDRPDGPQWHRVGEGPATDVALTEGPDDYDWREPDELPPPAPAPIRPLRARPVAVARLRRARLSTSPCPSPRPWYRTTPAAAPAHRRW